jgi:hypothetical protein
MRGNTRRFGNVGPWVANRAPANGGAPGLTEQNGLPYLAGTMSTSNSTYREPFGKGGEPFQAFNSSKTLRINHGEQGVAQDELSALCADQVTADYTSKWISTASNFEADIVKKMVRDVNAKMSSKKGPTTAWE